MSAPDVLRAGTLAVLVGLGFVALRVRGSEQGGVLELERAEPEAIAAALLDPAPPARLRWTGNEPPDARDLQLLTAGPAVPALSLPVGTPSALRVEGPRALRVGRNAAIGVWLEADPGDTVRISIADVLGGVDSVVRVAGADGVVEVGFRVRPGRAGSQRWTVRTGADSAAVYGWAAPDRPLRALVLGGTPDWESRFALRALEEAGVEVEVRYDLGRRVIGGGLPTDLDRVDAVLWMGEAELAAAEAERLLTFVRQGGGLMMAPSVESVRRVATSTLGQLLRGAGLPDSVAVGSLDAGEAPGWRLPPEARPLPSAPSAVRTLALVEAAEATPGASDARSERTVAVDGRGRALAALGGVGRGRVVYLGLAETWRWRMEGGAVEAHRGWWRDWVEWASGGLKGTHLVRTATPWVPVGSPVTVTVEALEPGAALPESLELWRPDGTLERLPVVGLDSGDDARARHATFLTSLPGAYRIVGPESETGVLAESGNRAATSVERSLNALASSRPGHPGIALTGPEAEREEGRMAAGGTDQRSWTGAAGFTPSLGMGLLLALMLAAEWSLRRRRGGP